MSTEPASTVALVRLLGWLSPGFPVGAFAYSHGLESAFERGTVIDRSSLEAWLTGLVAFGNARSDAMLLACAHRAVEREDPRELEAVAERGATFFGAPELARESLLQGAAFWQTVGIAWPHPRFASLAAPLGLTSAGVGGGIVRGRIAYPIAVGVATAVHGLARELTCAAHLHAFVANGVSAALRLGMIGQTDGQHVVRATESAVLAAAARAAEARLEDVGAASWAVDLHALEHETQTTRLFRS